MPFSGYTFKNNRWLIQPLFILLIFIQQGTQAVNTSNQVPICYVDQNILMPGDLIFRQGISAISRFVHMVDNGAVYTHVGIIIDEGGKLFVAHSVPAEAEDTSDYAKMEPLDKFLLPDRAKAMAVYRIKNSVSSSSAKQAAVWAHRQVVKHIPFDKAFDLEDSSHLYCTELVWRAYLQSGVDLCDGRFDKLTISFGIDKYILPSTLCGSKFLVPIYYSPTKTKTL